jgi:hypothetical protein
VENLYGATKVKHKSADGATPRRLPHSIYKWTAKGEEILEKIRRARAALEKVDAHELHKGN